MKYCMLPPMAKFSIFDYLVIGVYLGSMVVKGILFSGRQKSLKEYFHAGGNVPYLPLGNTTCPTCPCHRSPDKFRLPRGCQWCRMGLQAERRKDMSPIHTPGGISKTELIQALNELEQNLIASSSKAHGEIGSKIAGLSRRVDSLDARVMGVEQAVNVLTDRYNKSQNQLHDEVASVLSALKADV